jgi:hypothetical protein
VVATAALFLVSWLLGHWTFRDPRMRAFDAGEAMNQSYTARKSIQRNGETHFAEVTARASPTEGKNTVALSADVLSYLKGTFGADFEHQRHNVWAAVATQIRTIDVKGGYARAGATSFNAEVVGVRVSPGAVRDRELAGFLLSVAGMDAIGEYLSAWEETQSKRP